MRCGHVPNFAAGPQWASCWRSSLRRDGPLRLPGDVRLSELPAPDQSFRYALEGRHVAPALATRTPAPGKEESFANGRFLPGNPVELNAMQALPAERSQMVMPPSTESTCPVAKIDSSLAR